MSRNASGKILANSDVLRTAIRQSTVGITPNADGSKNIQRAKYLNHLLISCNQYFSTIKPTLYQGLRIRRSWERDGCANSIKSCLPRYSSTNYLKALWTSPFIECSRLHKPFNVLHGRKENDSYFGVRRWGRAISKRYKSSSFDAQERVKAHDEVKSKAYQARRDSTTPGSSKVVTSSPTNKHLMNRLPSIAQIHRPTKEELLAAAEGFWSRLKVRFKWFSIRSVRPFNIDEIGAFFSWVLLGHVLWVILGTTTFFSIAIFTVNTVFAQGIYLLLKTDILCLHLFRNPGSVGW